MSNNKSRPTTDELLETLKRTALPTVLVEGVNDIIFYRKIEGELEDIGVDMLPAGNKDAVLELHEKLKLTNISSPIAFIVDNDLWIHKPPANKYNIESIITTNGYSIENDLFIDGNLQKLLSPDEEIKFKDELHRFTRWYALSVNKQLNGGNSAFRTHPMKVLDDNEFYEKETALNINEPYPEKLFEEIIENYGRILRGKSLFAILVRQLSSKKREVKFSVKQLMELGASEKGENFYRICNAVKSAIHAKK